MKHVCPAAPFAPGGFLEMPEHAPQELPHWNCAHCGKPLSEIAAEPINAKTP